MRRYIWSNLIYDQDGHSEFADMYLVHVGRQHPSSQGVVKPQFSSLAEVNIHAQILRFHVGYNRIQ